MEKAPKECRNMTRFMVYQDGSMSSVEDTSVMSKGEGTATTVPALA
jgi:hypothetical protein